MMLRYGETATPQPMRGADGPRDRLAGLLLDVVPDKAVALRAAWDIGTTHLPDVGKISSGELPESVVTSLADAWVEVINPRMLPGLRRVDITPAGDPVYQTRYSCRIYVWCLGLDWDMAMIRRDKVATLVKLSLLEFPTLARAGGDTGWLVIEDTWTEEYGIPTRANSAQGNQSGRCWCSAALSVDVRAEEAMSAGRLREPIGQTASVILDLAAVGPAEVIPHDLPRPPGWATPELATDLAPPTNATGTITGADVESDTDLGGTP